jgi:hypothetical protein
MDGFGRPGASRQRAGFRIGAAETARKGQAKQIVETKCNQCHFLHRLTQQRWTRANWQQKITWMRERIHERGANDSDRRGTEDRRRLSGHELFGHGTKSRTQWPAVENPLEGRRRQVHRHGFREPNHDAAHHDVVVDSRGVAWVNQLNVYALGKFDPKTYTFSQLAPPALGTKPGTLAHMGPPALGAGDSIWMADIGGTRRWLEFNTKTEKFNSGFGAHGFQGPDQR